MGHRPTIMDVAKRAGVSKVTVSYVLNGHGQEARISPATSEKVMAAAKELGYSPNAIARMMVKKAGSTLGVVFQQAQYFTVWSSFTNEVMLGICQASVAQGYDLMLHTGSLHDSRSEADALADGRADGVLMLRNKDDATLNDLLKRSLPVVLFFCRADSPDAAFVDADNFGGGKLATDYLLRLGHKRIGIVTGDPDSTSSNERLRGYKASLESHQIPFDPRLSVAVTENPQSINSLVELLRSPGRPTAMFCWSDDAAIQTMEVARGSGLNVPQDLSVIGFDSLLPAQNAQPALTSVAQPVREIAKAATEMLINICKDEPVAQRQIVFPVKLDLRGSTAPPALE